MVADKLVYCHEALALHAKLHRMLLTSQSLSPGMRIQMRIQMLVTRRMRRLFRLRSCA